MFCSPRATPLHGREQRALQLGVLASAGAPFTEEVDLGVAHGLDVGVAQFDGSLEPGLAVEELTCPAESEEELGGGFEVGAQSVEGPLAVRGESGVARGDRESGLGHDHLDVIEERAEDGVGSGAALERFAAAFLFGGAEALEHAVPTGQHEAALGPGEDPGDGAQIGDATLGAARGRARAEVHALDDVDRCGVAEVGEEFGVVVDSGTVGLARSACQVFENGAFLVRRALALAFAEAEIENGSGGDFQRALGDAAKPIPRVDDLALFGDAES